MEKIIMKPSDDIKAIDTKIDIFKKQHEDVISQMLKASGLNNVIVLMPNKVAEAKEELPLSARKTLCSDGEPIPNICDTNHFYNFVEAYRERAEYNVNNKKYGFIGFYPSKNISIDQRLDLHFLHELSHLIQNNDKNLSADLLDKGVGETKFRERQAQFIPFVIMFLKSKNKEEFIKNHLDDFVNLKTVKSTFNGYNQYKDIKKFIKDYKDGKIGEGDSINIESIYNYTKNVVSNSLQAEANAIREKIEEEKGKFLNTLSPKDKEDYEHFLEYERGIKDNNENSSQHEFSFSKDADINGDSNGIKYKNNDDYVKDMEIANKKKFYKSKYQSLYKKIVNLEKNYNKEFYLMNEMLRKVTSCEYNSEEVNDSFLLDILNSDFYEKEMDKTLFSHTYIYSPRAEFLTLEKNTILNALKGQSKYGNKGDIKEYINTKIKCYSDRVKMLDDVINRLHNNPKSNSKELVGKINVFKGKLEKTISNIEKSLISIEPEKTVSTSNTEESPTPIGSLYKKMLKLEPIRLNKIKLDAKKLELTAKLEGKPSNQNSLQQPNPTSKSHPSSTTPTTKTSPKDETPQSAILPKIDNAQPTNEKREKREQQQPLEKEQQSDKNIKTRDIDHNEQDKNVDPINQDNNPVPNPDSNSFEKPADKDDKILLDANSFTVRKQEEEHEIKTEEPKVKPEQKELEVKLEPETPKPESLSPNNNNPLPSIFNLPSSQESSFSYAPQK
ncbi:MAG: hypothetical protein LBC92_05200, partial [Rickettsiales bacterium]|nr:hypothetical protein [Rickettsiales bacterium]